MRRCSSVAASSLRARIEKGPAAQRHVHGKDGVTSGILGNVLDFFLKRQTICSAKAQNDFFLLQKPLSVFMKYMTINKGRPPNRSDHKM